jgi:hypothetical protein
MVCRGIRGATTVETNSREEILSATRQLLGLMIRLNDVQPEDVACAGDVFPLRALAFFVVSGKIRGFAAEL